MKPTSNNDLPCLGWREWVALPQLHIPQLKAKIDTGARTSALHAFSHEFFHDRGVEMVRFAIHPRQNNSDMVIECVHEVLEHRYVSDSGGHRERRPVIITEVQLGAWRWPIEMTLTNRDTMRFRMLLGRTAINSRFLVDPNVSYLQGREDKSLW